VIGCQQLLLGNWQLLISSSFVLQYLRNRKSDDWSKIGYMQM